MLLIAAADQPLDLGMVEALDTAAARAGRVEAETAAHLFHHVFGLVVVQVGFAPQADGLDDHLSEVRMRLRDCQMTAHFGLVCGPLSRHGWVRIRERVRKISRQGDSTQFDPAQVCTATASSGQFTERNSPPSP
jgi:hypothetical protein